VYIFTRNNCVLNKAVSGIIANFYSRRGRTYVYIHNHRDRDKHRENMTWYRIENATILCMIRFSDTTSITSAAYILGSKR